LHQNAAVVFARGRVGASVASKASLELCPAVDDERVRVREAARGPREVCDVPAAV